MAVTVGMFLFEVVIQSVQSLVESRYLIIRSDFADIFSLELKDPKQMHIVMPEPPPLPPEPPGKGKKKKPPKPKKGKKGKKGIAELPPPEPVIQSGQSVLFTSSAEFLIQNMLKYPLEVSLWSKEDNLVYIGSTSIPWDNLFLKYLEQVCNCKEPPPVTLNEEYNVFEEGTAKLMAKIGLQVKLTYLTDRVTTTFRTLSEDPTVKKCLYTGVNSKTTSYICTLKTTDEDFEENCNKIENKFIKDKPKPTKITYASYKNAPAADTTFFNEGDYCCMGNADKPPQSVYKKPDTCPDVDFIIDYIRKVVASCNDNMRMLTPRPTITPRVKATDIDRLCYCKETRWPTGELADRFKREVQGEPCPICINAEKKIEGRAATFDLANIRGPCGRADCKVAREMRDYIEKLVIEDDEEFNINDLIGPCGSRSCDIAEKIKDFLRHEGTFSQGSNVEGLSTQCACIQQMQDALTKRKSCSSTCSKDCEESNSEQSICEGVGCPFLKKPQVYNVYYFTVEHDLANKPGHSGTSTPGSEISLKFKYCSSDCPSMKASEKTSCSRSVCLVDRLNVEQLPESSKCKDPMCPSEITDYAHSPADSNVVLDFHELHNPCCVKSCNAVDFVKDFIAEGVMNNKKRSKSEKDEDPCYCDCVCTFKFSNKTTYCAVCGGYECLGDDMKDQPEYAKPHPCPVYNKLYDKKYIKVKSAFPEEEEHPEPESTSVKSFKTFGSKAAPTSLIKKLPSSRSMKSLSDKVDKGDQKIKKAKHEKKKVGKFTANVEATPVTAVEKPKPKYRYPPVPKHMGWNWTADDIPGLKPRPKWRPGAANKILVRRYRAIREGLDMIAKKKRALMQRKKKIETKPMIMIKKQDGEYTVQMEVFKKYSKERLIFQQPFDEKPPIVYTIGKTEGEKLLIKKQRERRERRETRRKSKLLQSTFRDRCQEICLKAYNQSLGILPLPNPNDPDCPCKTTVAPGSTPPIDSCSCSENGSVTSSDTDGDDWIIEFSPPAARFDPKAKHPPVLVENESQYTYLDYKVKLFDKQGNPIPRFFKGPDGKQICSDLGGFWSHDHVWTEINKDGYIGPDNRWIPMNFTGPDGMAYGAEEGSFTDSNGRLLKLGIDGYIDKDGKWQWYKKRTLGTKPSAPGSMIAKKTPAAKPSTAITKLMPAGFSPTPKGKQATQKPTITKGDDAKVKKTVTVKGKGKNPLVMNFSVNYKDSRIITRNHMKYASSGKYNLDPTKLAKYREIMQGLEMYDDLHEMKMPRKTDRASNTQYGKQTLSSPLNEYYD